MANTEDLLKLSQALSVVKDLHSQNQDDGSSEGGEEGGRTGGQGGTEVEKRLFVEMFGGLRVGEKAFGQVGEFDVSAYLATNKKQQFSEGTDPSNRLKNHPILSKISKFDGDTSKMTMDPSKNPDAQDRYENKLQLQLGLKPGQAPKSAPTFKPSGM